VSLVSFVVQVDGTPIPDVRHVSCFDNCDNVKL
jgi:hypothetical protein